MSEDITEDQNDEQDISTMPRHLQESYAKATAEIEKYRTLLEKAENDLAERASGEERIAKVKADNEAALLALHRENVVIKYDIPRQHAHRLIGNTREELEADAQSLLDMFA